MHSTAARSRALAALCAILFSTLVLLGADAPPSPAGPPSLPDPPIPTGPAEPPQPAGAPAPVFPRERANSLFASLESMMILGDYHSLDGLIWAGLPDDTRAAWRTAMKHEFQQITYREKFTTSIYDWRRLTADDLAAIPSLPPNLPPTATLWAVRVDINYRYQPKSRLTATPAPAATAPSAISLAPDTSLGAAGTPASPGGGGVVGGGGPGTAAAGAAPVMALTPAEIDANRDEQSTVCFYLIDSGDDLRIIGSKNDYFMQFGRALPRGLIGSWAIGLITAFLVIVFWVTMASHCWAARPKLRRWRWITALVPVAGAIAYFFWVYWRKPRRPFLSMSLLQNLRASGLRAALQGDSNGAAALATAAPAAIASAQASMPASAAPAALATPPAPVTAPTPAAAGSAAGTPPPANAAPATPAGKKNGDRSHPA